MLHARKDYQCVQPVAGLVEGTMPTIGENEPVFLLRAKDQIAPDTLDFWASQLEKAGGDPDTVAHVRRWAGLMRKWQHENESKIPDAAKEVHQEVG